MPVLLSPCLARPSTQQGAEGPSNSRFSYLAQKRRTSLSELTGFFEDLTNEAESDRMSIILPNDGSTEDVRAAAGEEGALSPPLSVGQGGGAGVVMKVRRDR